MDRATGNKQMRVSGFIPQVIEIDERYEEWQPVDVGSVFLIKEKAEEMAKKIAKKKFGKLKEEYWSIREIDVISGK